MSYGPPPGYSPYPGQPSPVPPAQTGLNGFGLTSLILGILAAAVCWLPFIGIVGILFAIAGLVFGILGITMLKYRERRTLAIIGTIVCSVAGVAAMILPWITGAFFVFDWFMNSGVIEDIEDWATTYPTTSPDFTGAPFPTTTP
ncbi:hypothetical protein [Gulosibacter sp. 10]|uniref:hypothetical protein n=1 Tax=Gulosibacter sp. 10 TaxID=1255570 RepID=UPI00097F24BA|nr:hypothetical protein [Gulosibacter sp. 10]SJM66969.1 hypothetical protein FM112_12190 [Gulosibacter sp. 10]